MGILERIRPTKLASYYVDVGNLRIAVQASQALPDETRAIALKHWEQVESLVVRNPSFKNSMFPVPVGEEAPPLAREMAEAAQLMGTGPMVAFSGALVQAIALDLSLQCREVIVSTEGDTFVISERPRTFVVERSKDPRGGGIGVRVADGGRYAFYSSAGRLRLDSSIGKARVVAVLGQSGAITDAVASAMGNSLHRPDDVHRAFEICQRVDGIRGAVLLVGSRIGVWGDIEIVPARI